MMIPTYPAQPMICLGILYGFLTVFCVTPSQILCARAFLIKGDSAGSIALIGSLIGQLFIFFLVLSPLGVIWNRCYFGFVLTSLWFLFRIKKEFQLKSLKYKDFSKPSLNNELILFADSFIFQLLNPIALPNSICYRIVTPLLFRYSNNLIFIISLTIGWVFSNFFFLQITKNLKDRIEYDYVRTYQSIIPSLNNVFINFLWSMIFISISRFTWGIYKDAWIQKDQWFHPLRLEKLRIKPRTSQYFFNNLILPDQNNRIFTSYLPKWSNLIDEIENYVFIKKPCLIDQNLKKNIKKEQATSNLTKLPIIKSNIVLKFSSKTLKLYLKKDPRRDLSLFREKRSFNYVGYIQKWLSNSWNIKITETSFFPFPWEPLTLDEKNEVLLLLNHFNNTSLQTLINQKLKNKLLVYKDNTIKHLPGTPLGSKKHNEKIQKWQEQLEFLPIRIGIRKLQSLRAFIKKNRQENFAKKLNLNLIKLQPSFIQQTSLNNLFKRKIAILKLDKQSQFILSRKEFSTYTKEAIKSKKRTKRPKGTLKAQLRKKHENKRFLPFRYSYIFQVTKFRDSLVKRQDNQISQGISSIIKLQDEEKRWLIAAQKSLYIRDLQKQQLKKQREIAYKKSPFRWLANFVYTSNLLLFLKLRKPLLYTKAAFKCIVCFLLKKDFSFKQEIKNLNDYLYLIYDVEGNLMPSGKLPDWWFIHGFTIKRKLKEEKTGNRQKEFQVNKRKKIDNNLNFILKEKFQIDKKKNYKRKKKSQIKSISINSKKDNLVIVPLARVVLFLKLTNIKYYQMFFYIFINFTKKFKSYILDLKLNLSQKIKNQNIWNRIRILFHKAFLNPIEVKIIKNSISSYRKIELKIKKILLLNRFSLKSYITSFLLNNMSLSSENWINVFLIKFFKNTFALDEFTKNNNLFISFSYINLLERLSKYRFISYIHPSFPTRQLCIKPNFKEFDSRKKNINIVYLKVIEKNKNKSKTFLRNLEEYNQLFISLQQVFFYKKHDFNLLIKNYLRTLLTKKYVKFSANKQNISLIKLRLTNNKDTLSLQKKLQLKNILKKIQLNNTNRYLETWLIEYTVKKRVLNQKTQQETERIISKIYKIKKKKTIEEFLNYLYFSLFNLKGDLRKNFSKIINICFKTYIPYFLKPNNTKIDQWPFFFFYNQKLELFYYILVDKTNSLERIKESLKKTKGNKELNLPFITTFRKTSTQVYNNFYNSLNSISGFLGDSYSIIENSSYLLNFTSKKKIDTLNLIRGINNESLQQIKMSTNIAYQIFCFLLLDDNSNFCYSNSPNLMLNSLCSKNQSYDFLKKHKKTIYKIKDLSKKNILFKFNTLIDDYLVPNYQIENIVCMERVWISNGQKYSSRRIFTDPWITSKFKNIQNFISFYKDPFFLS
jgi:hypothetical protein